MKIKYVKHPVKPEQKAKIISEGFKIVDAKHKEQMEKILATKEAEAKKDAE